MALRLDNQLKIAHWRFLLKTIHSVEDCHDCIFDWFVSDIAHTAMLCARNIMPAHLLDQLITEQNQKLGLTVKEIAKLEESRTIPLTDDVISSLLEFSAEFAKHLEATEQTFEGRRTVVDGLDCASRCLPQEWRGLATPHQHSASARA